jgi:predicted DsbA family dithiol-disulfide isomerase
LRPRPQTGRDIDKFRGYTKSWLRPNEEDDAGTFRVWQTDHGPPSHSIPPHLLAKAAARLDPVAGRALSERLFEAYFSENLDITDPETMRAIWLECGLADADFDGVEAPGILREVLDQHNEALSFGVNGVPAIMLVGNDVPITGAHPRSLYRRWIDRTLEAREHGE